MSCVQNLKVIKKLSIDLSTSYQQNVDKWNTSLLNDWELWTFLILLEKGREKKGRDGSLEDPLSLRLRRSGTKALKDSA